ncbi:MAG: phosphate ABC transporter ATP-binding protein [Mariprofundaceae bacterium]
MKAEYIERVTAPEVGLNSSSLRVEHLDLQLDGKAILSGIVLSLPARGVTTLIGPSGAGKTSLLHCLNGLRGAWQGRIEMFGREVRDWPGGGDALRRCAGLISQKPSVFPCSIRDNVLFGLRGKARRALEPDWVETCLRKAVLWDEVADRLDARASSLSVGQQQRLCLARALAMRPRLLLADEPTASLDPRSRQMIEASLLTMAGDMPVLCVTHDMEQARRLGGRVIFMCDGRIIESADSADFFDGPQRIESREFLRWSVCDCD